MTPTLYLTRTGILEPLGQSQVLAYLRGLSSDYAVTLISFERDADLDDNEHLTRVEGICADHGIRWVRLRYQSRLRILASAWNLGMLVYSAWREARRNSIRLIHARSYIPVAAAWAVWRLTGTPFIFDMRGLWPEELITAGRLRRSSVIHCMLVRLERLCLRDAAAVVSLTEAAVQYLEDHYPKELLGQRVRVIPTCADLDRFSLPPERPEVPVYGCIGSVLNGWFRVDWLATFFRAVARQDAKARFEIVTRDDAGTVRERLDPEGALEHLSIFASPSQTIHESVQRQIASAMFYAGGEPSELGRSPTRMAEILGCGIPVVANEGVGDVAKVIRRYRVGVIARDGSDGAMDEAVLELARLRKDPDLPARCRHAAEEVFSLERGTEAYRALYGEITASGDAATPFNNTRRP